LNRLLAAIEVSSRISDFEFNVCPKSYAGTILIKPVHPSLPEKAEIEVHDADDLYREIRIDNALVDEHGHKVKLREHADVDVVIEANPKATVKTDDKK
jgi:hypothetical protein